MKLKQVFILSVISAITLLLLGCGAAQAPQGQNPANNEPLVVGLDDNFPPMGFRDENNEIVGFDVDLAKETAKRLGRPVEFKPIDWDKKEEELKSGRIDVIWNGLEITEKRKEDMLFSDPYMNNRQILFIKAGTTPPQSEADLAGKIVGTQSGGGTAEDYLDGHENLRNSFKDYKKYADFVTAFQELEKGNLDVVVGDEIVGRYYMTQHPNTLEAVNFALGPVGTIGIGFGKNNTELRDKVQRVMNDMKVDGFMTQCAQKWFKINITDN